MTNRRTTHQHKRKEREDGTLLVIVLALAGFIGFLIVMAPGPQRRARVRRAPVHAAAQANRAWEEEMPPCRDGRDNDYDRKIDYPEDEGCDSPSDSTESFACNDGIDNDNDGVIDGRDPGCSSGRDNTEDIVDTCDDHHDNDGDGRTDFPADDGCDSASDPRED